MEQVQVFRNSEGKLFIQFSNMFRYEMRKGKVNIAFERVKEAIRHFAIDQAYFDANKGDFNTVQRWCRARCLVSSNPLEAIPRQDLPFEYTRTWAYVKPDGELTVDVQEAKDARVYSRIIDRLTDLGYKEEDVEHTVKAILSAPDFKVCLEEKGEMVDTMLGDE